MYAKVFSQIFDSSIADDYVLRHVFEDLLKLADIDGVVDMTQEAIAARTRIPLRVITDCISKLMQPDPRSRTPDEDGRRLILVDSHRDWGWKIVNYAVYRDMRDEGSRRGYMRDYMRNYRDSNDKHVNTCKQPVNTRKLSVNTCKQLLTPVNSCKPLLAQVEVEVEEEVDVKREGEVSPPPLLKEPKELPAEAERWNIVCGSISRVAACSSARMRYLCARRKDPFWKANLEAGLEKIKASTFCQGVNDRGWKASFDWLLQPDSLAKIIEGKYDNRSEASKRNSQDNPRNNGICRAGPDYGELSKLKQLRQQNENSKPNMAQELAEKPIGAVPLPP